MLETLNGKKTYIGAAIIALGAFLTALGYPDIGKNLTLFGESLAVLGIGHKLAKQ